MIRRYTELKNLNSFDDRYAYLRLSGFVGTSTFGFERYLNQIFYRSKEWKAIRSQVIVRDNGCDLGIPGYEIDRHIIVHHMNPINVEDLEEGNSQILNPEFLVCVSNVTHLAIHFGDKTKLPQTPVHRCSGDMIPWR